MKILLTKKKKKNERKKEINSYTNYSMVSIR